MPRKRISGPERRILILGAARRVFSRHGFDGAKTMQIAQEAGVSEALVYRHFPSKRALYRAVLRQIFREQDENWKVLSTMEPGAAAIVRTQRVYYRTIITMPESEALAGYRLTLASLSGDGYFARILYRRSQRLNLRAVTAAVEAARAAGEIVGRPAHIGSTTMFTEHVGTMLSAVYGLDAASRPYGLDGEALVREAVWFTCRGIGMSDAAIERYIDD
jgi:AcrR family transcriptional regulator